MRRQVNIIEMLCIQFQTTLWAPFSNLLCVYSTPEENLVSHLGPSSLARGGPRFSDDWPSCLARFPLDAESS